MKRFLSATLLLTVSLIANGAEEKPAAAQAKRTAVQEFKTRTQQEMVACSGHAFSIVRKATEMENIAAQEPTKACVIAGREKVRDTFPDALKQVSNNPAASALLEDFYSAWLASFDNLGRGARETIPQFEKRSAEERAKYEALWKRFEKAAAKKNKRSP